MRARKNTTLIRALGLAVLLGTLIGCEASEDEQATVAVVNDGMALLEANNVGKALRLTTEDFLVQPGRLNRKAVAGRLLGVFRAYGDIQILHPSLDVELRESGGSALVSTPFVVARKGVSRDELDNLNDDPEAWEALAGTFTKVAHAEISLVKENDRWLIHTIRF